MDDGKKQERLNSSAAKAADILLSFCNNEELGVTELSRDLKLPKSTIYILLRTLKAKGLIEQNTENSRYRLGIKAFQLGLRWVRIRDIRVAARIFMQQLSEELNTAVHLSILSGDRVIIVEKIEPHSSFLVVPGIGWPMPIHSTASGKLLLAFSSDEVIDRIVNRNELIKYNDNTITDIKMLKKALYEICKHGYSLDEEETLEGIMCIAVPIYDYTNSVVAALSISGGTESFAQISREELVLRIKARADMISAQLGYKL
ncbi:MAG: IclR family transcriptional regulator [Dehalococcoidia bacterium]|nr:IclR family transcriptional regulator [Dehalococcoidia bacterium]